MLLPEADCDPRAATLSNGSNIANIPRANSMGHNKKTGISATETAAYQYSPLMAIPISAAPQRASAIVHFRVPKPRRVVGAMYVAALDKSLLVGAIISVTGCYPANMQCFGLFRQSCCKLAVKIEKLRFFCIPRIRVQECLSSATAHLCCFLRVS